MKESPIFSTANIDLATFLMLEGIKLIEHEVITKSGVNRKVVIMHFLDERENCLDLERVFLNSTYKKFRDINKYLLRKVHEAIRGE